MTMQATTEVRKTLHLRHPIGSTQQYTQGADGCTSIEQTSTGGYEVHFGSRLVRVPEWRVDYYEQDPRPGYAHEQESAKAEAAPKFAVPMSDGSYLCNECGASKKTLHAMKIHYGRSHAAQR